MRWAKNKNKKIKKIKKKKVIWWNILFPILQNSKLNYTEKKEKKNGLYSENIDGIDALFVESC